MSFSKWVSDLRFVIGLFFTIMGTILLATAIWGPDDRVEGIRLNLTSGSVMLAFGVLMVGLSYLRPAT